MKNKILAALLKQSLTSSELKELLNIKLTELSKALQEMLNDNQIEIDSDKKYSIIVKK
jgi:transcription initiation factor IIE alpha subunit